MFPLRDDNPTVHASIITFIIIGINAAVWIFVQGMGFDPALTKSVGSFGLIPGELLGTLPAGTRIPLSQHFAYIIEDSPNYLTLITSMFMHGGWFHIIGNMWFLAVFGDNIEDSMGWLRFILFYLLCGLAAAGTQMFLSPSSGIPMVGASGAISGIMGAYAVLYPRAPVHMLVFFGFFFTRIIVPAFLMLGYWFLLQLAGSAVSHGSGVAFGAHIGGFVAGVVLIWFFRKKDRMKRKSRGVWVKWR